MYEHKENTFFENVLQFSPGYVFQIDGNIKIKKKKYWCLFDIVKRSSENNKIKDINIASELVENEVNRIIETYLRSDTKISLLYSSGLDSNALFNLANSKKNKIPKQRKKEKSENTTKQEKSKWKRAKCETET